jgi:hypothetical protein
MRSARVIALFAIALSAASVAKADMMNHPSASQTAPTATSPASPLSTGSSDTLFEGLGVSFAALGQSGISHVPSDGTAAVDIPAPPSSATLFLWAVGSFGASWLGRSAGKLHMGHAPSWFHSGGPDQIGHASRINLDFGVMLVNQDRKSVV